MARAERSRVHPELPELKARQFGASAQKRNFKVVLASERSVRSRCSQLPRVQPVECASAAASRARRLKE